MLKVKDHAGLVRDPHSKAILNTDKDALGSHRKHRKMMKQAFKTSDEVDKLTEEVETMKTDINEIKNLLKQLISNQGN